MHNQLNGQKHPISAGVNTFPAAERKVNITTVKDIGVKYLFVAQPSSS